MRNAHLRFGALGYSKTTKDTTTQVSVRLERFIGERQGSMSKAHLISVVGSDAELGAIWAGILEDACFTVEGPDFERSTVQLGPGSACFRGTITIPGRNHAVRHIVAVSGELSQTRPGADLKGTKTIVCDSDSRFVFYRLTRRFGLPVVPSWSDWFAAKLKSAGAIRPLIGLGCSAVVISGGKAMFLKWIAAGLRKGDIRIPAAHTAELWNPPAHFSVSSDA